MSGAFIEYASDPNLHPSLGTATRQYAATSVELEVVEHASWESSASD